MRCPPMTRFRLWRDDLPCWMTTAEGPLLCLPYTWEINDVPMWAV